MVRPATHRQAGWYQRAIVGPVAVPTRPLGDLAGLRPGDVGFYYAPKQTDRHRTLKQWLIGMGQSYGRLIHPGSGGDSRVLHTYIVLQVYPVLGRIRVADAALDHEGREGVGTSYYDFYTQGPYNPGGSHLFYRFVDPRLVRAVCQRAEAWASYPSKNFSNARAAMAPFRSWTLLSGARRHIRHLMSHAPMAGPVPQIYGRGPYPLMCSNFVSSVCLPAVVDLYCRDQRLDPIIAPSTLVGLKAGSAGHIFDCDPRWMLPSTLQARFAKSKAVAFVATLGTDGGNSTPLNRPRVERQGAVADRLSSQRCRLPRYR